jgi:hypothetical protein
MSEFKRCNSKRMCRFLQERVICGICGGVGLHTVDTTSFRTGKTYFRGVAYKTSAKDNGLVINYCPFCGKRPGIGFKKARAK